MQQSCPARITRKKFNAIDCNVNSFLYTLSLVLSSELAWKCIIQIAQIDLTTVSVLSYIFIQNCISICLPELPFSVSIYLGVFQSWFSSLVLNFCPSCSFRDLFRFYYLHYKNLWPYSIHGLPTYFDLPTK